MIKYDRLIQTNEYIVAHDNKYMSQILKIEFCINK